MDNIHQHLYVHMASLCFPYMLEENYIAYSKFSTFQRMVEHFYQAEYTTSF